MVKAGIASALALTLLAPTFNALNLSYVENVTPPPWMPPPTQPPDITPPTNFKPPTGMTPPTGYEGEIPPGACPPPVFREIEGTAQDLAIQGPSPGAWTRTIPFQVPEGALAFGGWMNFTDWQGQRAVVAIDGPSGFDRWTDFADGGGGLLISPTARTDPFEYNSTATDAPRAPPAGDYTLDLRVDTPISGSVQTRLIVALACGGMMTP